MSMEALIRRIGGSTFAKLPPAVVKTLGLHAGDVVLIDVRRQGATGSELDAIRGKLRKLPPMTERPWDT